jgi:hypothetical protein
MLNNLKGGNDLYSFDHRKENENSTKITNLPQIQESQLGKKSRQKMNFKELNDDTLSYGSDEHNLKNSINPTKRQKISVDFDLPDSSILQESLASAMNNKMAETVREMEKKLSKQMGK